MKKKYICTLSLMCSIYISAQVGIKTPTPQAELHVNGSLQVTKELSVGGSATTLGEPGTVGEFLTSQGSGLPPKWKKPADIDIPQITNVALRSNTKSFSANNWSVVSFETLPKNDTTYLTYSSTTGYFKVVKSGYYLLTGYLEYVISGSPSDGTAVTGLYKNNEAISHSDSAHPVSASIIEHNITGLEYFNEGDSVSLEGTFTRNFSLRNASLSFMYLGN
ncbi:hypothetical protein [Chryseobacterium oryctis]|uniref:C1q domain-containing protein n=1 Tax=Chryseobacterium oryctis TaxID=2952618 RepID=A0ABT3HN46_9FLAO|nr:hypothetical protein [Chryseobacterium oryctis]MCW3161125.1 hypothetical protein [Chryseobacterium oryctis]